MAKYTLQNDENIFDFVLIGISSNENQYVIINNINSQLNIDLFLHENLKLSQKNHEIFEFSIYHFSHQEMALEYFLVPNKSNYKSTIQSKAVNDLFSNTGQSFEETVLLINELPRTDYFLLLKGESAIHEQYNVFKLLKEIEVINQVHEIIPEKLSSRNNLIF